MSEQLWPCIVCGNQLNGAPQTCGRCIGAVRANLNRIEVDYQLLAIEMLARSGTAKPPEPNGDIHGQGNPLPGGDLMVMAGPGATRTHADAYGDTDSVLGALERWEADWRITFEQPAATGWATVESCMPYLLRHLGRAAHEHPAFDEFAGDMRELRYAMDVALRLHPQRSEVPCIHCKTRTLEREEPRNGRALEWRCTRCHRGYTESEYYVAARQHGEERHGHGGGASGVSGDERERRAAGDQAA